MKKILLTVSLGSCFTGLFGAEQKFAPNSGDNADSKEHSSTKKTSLYAKRLEDIQKELIYYSKQSIILNDEFEELLISSFSRVKEYETCEEILSLVKERSNLIQEKRQLIQESADLRQTRLTSSSSFDKYFEESKIIDNKMYKVWQELGYTEYKLDCAIQQEIKSLEKKRDDLIQKERQFRHDRIALQQGNCTSDSTYGEYVREKRATQQNLDEVTQKLRAIENELDLVEYKKVTVRKRINDIDQKILPLSAEKCELEKKEWDQFLYEVIEPAFQPYVEDPSKLTVQIVKELESKINGQILGWHSISISQWGDIEIHRNGKTPIDLALAAENHWLLEHLLKSAKKAVRADLLEKIHKYGTEDMKKLASLHWRKFDPSLLGEARRLKDLISQPTDNIVLNELVIKPPLINHLLLPVAVVSRNMCVALGGSILSLFK